MTSTYPSFTQTYHHDVYDAIRPTQEHLSCQGLNVLITGAGTGIGQAIAIAYAQAHAKNIVVFGRTLETLQETADKIVEASGGKTSTHPITTNITDSEAVQAAFKTAKEQVGSLDILVNCAGGLLAHGPVAEIDIAGYWKTIELNVLGPTIVSQEFIKAAQADDNEKAKPRTLINIASGIAHIPYAPQAVAYAVAKTASTRLTEYIHYEHPSWRVFNLQPGVVATALAKKSGRAGEDEPQLAAGACVWLSRDPRAVELSGRFIWANWDVDELCAMSDKIKKEDSLMLHLKGWAQDYTAQDILDRAKATLGRK